MLQRIRENVTGWVAWVIIIFLSVPFAFWGINQYFSDTSGGKAAEVNGTEIPLALVDQAYQKRYNELVRMFGDQLPPGLINEQALRREQLERLIMEEILEQEARELKLRVDDVALQSAIRDIAAFQVEGSFDQERYRQMLSINGRTPTSFEASFRRDLGLQQLQRGLVETGFATVIEAARSVALDKQSRRHEAVSIPDEMFRQSIELMDADVEAYYSTNTDRFLTEETVDIAYVALDKQAYADAIELTDADLQEAYQLRASDYASQEERVASHILIEGDDEKALARAQEIVARLDAGEDFAELAKNYSDDPVSAEDGGNLGEIAQGQLEGPFEDTLFSLQEGEYSEPVQTDFGYHIIRLDAIKAPELPSFESIRDELAADLTTRRVEEQFESDVQQLADTTFADDGSLEGAADEFGLEIHEIRGVTRVAGEGIAANPDVRTAAFSDIVLAERRNSDPLRLDDNGRVVVLRVTAHEPPEPKPLEMVAEQVREQLMNERTRELAQAKADAILQRAKDGGSLESIAQAEGLIYRAPSTTARDTADISRAYANALFSADYPVDGEVFGSTAVEDRDFVVFGLLEVMPGSYADLGSSEARAKMQSAEQVITNGELAAYLAELRNVADVTIFEKNLKEKEQESE